MNFLTSWFNRFSCPSRLVEAINTPIIEYVDGDATRPIGIGKKLIIHCCNDIGGWGRGFVLALNKRDESPKNQYKIWFNSNTPPFRLGEVQFVPYAEQDIADAEQDIVVANMIGQHGIYKDEDGNPPVRYDAIRKCLKKVRKYSKRNNMSVHAPKFGSDLAGGKWEIIEKIIEEELTNKGISVTVYEWKG